MTETCPGLDQDELTIRDWLRKRGVGPDADEPQLPSAPAQLPDGFEPRPPDWLDEILDGNAEAGADEEPEPATSTDPDPDPVDDDPDEEPAPRERRRPHVELSRTSLADALAALTPKQRWLLTHGTAAAAGWLIGLVNWGTDTARWFAAGHRMSSSAWTNYGLAAIVIYRRTRHRPFPVAWLAAVPVSSVTLGALLYGRAA
ncbi:hypothetical protein ACFCWV_37590 [Streptomyces sp. NPDC056341]|uniref:hypothetical protein n=1 Tax=Streptomyces sp. NPDC056341 TaxID=3345788 RepID=UPI0035D8FDFB